MAHCSADRGSQGDAARSSTFLEDECGYHGGTGDDVVTPRRKVQPQDAGKAGRGRAGKRQFRGRDDGMKAGGGRLPPPEKIRLYRPQRWVLPAALWRASRFLEALPCASAKRSRLLLEVFDDGSSVSRRLSLRERAIIREVNETVFA